MKNGIIKYGFLIDGGKIYDTKIQAYKLEKQFSVNNLIYTMKPSLYKRLYEFEILLLFYSIDKVFELLNFNSKLKKNRLSEVMLKLNKLHYISNMSTIYNYPPIYLTQKRFTVYKVCQKLKKRIDYNEK